MNIRALPKIQIDLDEVPKLLFKRNIHHLPPRRSLCTQPNTLTRLLMFSSVEAFDILMRVAPGKDLSSSITTCKNVSIISVNL